MSGELVLRPLAEGEEERVVEVFNRASQAMYGADDTTPAEFRVWLTEPNVEPARDIRVAERGGELLGYADVYDQNGMHTRYWLDVRLDPVLADEETAEALVAWVETRAEGERGPGAFLRGFVPERAALLKLTLEESGYALIRHSYRMAIDLPSGSPEPEWPDGVRVRPMEPGEERAVYEVHEECFADHWEHVREPYEEWAHWTVAREDFDPSLWWVVVDGDEIAAYALCRQHDAETDMGWVEMLGTRPPWRRRGLGKALLHHVFREFERRDGYRRVGLGVDAASLTGANRLYESVGMRVVRQSDVYQKDLS
jgi:mycothiol synthase